MKWYLLNAGPTKKKLWNLFLITFLRPLQAGGTQNRSLKSGGALLQAQPQLLFQISCVPRSRMTPLPLFERNCVKSLHHFFIRFVFAVFFHFHRIFCFGSNKHHSPRHVALRLRLLPLLVFDIFPESDPSLDRSSPAVQGDYMARYNYAR